MKSSKRKQIYSLKFQRKLVEEQDILSIYCPKCRRKHPLRECPFDIKETNKCAICADNHATKKCPSIPGLKAILQGRNLKLNHYMLWEHEEIGLR